MAEKKRTVKKDNAKKTPRNRTHQSVPIGTVHDKIDLSDFTPAKGYEYLLKNK